MKLQYLSDLHLEFPLNRAYLKENPIIPSAEILIIAGDTYHLDKDFSQLEFIQQVSEQFEKVFLLPGNHEYYGGFDASTALKSMDKYIFPNVRIVNNKVIQIEDTQLVFTTLWSEITKYPDKIKRAIYDFWKIKYNGFPLSTYQFNDLHYYSFRFLEEACQAEGEKIVITHHLPSFQCNVEEFMFSKWNEAFCVDKHQFIVDSDIKYWIYGHSHRNKKDFEINGTKMITNQMGYVEYGEQSTFRLDKTIDL